MLNNLTNLLRNSAIKFKRDKIFRNSIIISSFLILGQFLSIYRERVLVQYIGVGVDLDIYNSAFKIPDLIYGLFFGFVATTTMIPYLSKYSNGDILEYNKKFNSSLFGFLFCTSIVSVIVIIFMDSIVRIYASYNFAEDDYQRLVLLSRILMLQPILLGLSMAFSSLGQIKDNFYTYSLAPILYTIANILGVIFMYKDYGLEGVIYFVIIGAFLHMSLQFYHLKLSNIKLRLQHFCFKSFKEHMILAIPRSSSYTATQVFNIILTYFTLSIGPAILSAYVLSRKVFDVPIQIILTGISNSSIPTLSKMYSDHRYEDFKSLYKKNLKNIIIFSIVSFVIIVLFSESILKILYGDIDNMYIINYILIGMAFTITLSTFNWYITVFFSVIKKVFIVSRINIISVIIILILAINLAKNINNLLLLFLFYVIFNSICLLLFFWKEYKKML